MAPFVEMMKEVQALSAFDQEDVGWFLLLGLGFDPKKMKRTRPPERWRDGSRPTDFFHWMAWLAAAVGWDKAYDLADEELENLSGDAEFFNCLDQLMEWLDQEWMRNPPDYLSQILGHPKFSKKEVQLAA